MGYTIPRTSLASDQAKKTTVGGTPALSGTASWFRQHRRPVLAEGEKVAIRQLDEFRDARDERIGRSHEGLAVVAALDHCPGLPREHDVVVFQFHGRGDQSF